MIGRSKTLVLHSRASLEEYRKFKHLLRLRLKGGTKDFEFFAKEDGKILLEDPILRTLIIVRTDEIDWKAFLKSCEFALKGGKTSK